MKKILRFTRILLIATLMAHCSTPPPATVMVRPATCAAHLQFAEADDINALIGFADKMRKPIFLHFSVSSMADCQIMEQRAFTNGELAAYYNLHFINYKVDLSKNGQQLALADRYGVTRFPTQVYIDGKGKMMYRHEGPATAAQLLEVGYSINNAFTRDVLSLGED
jgi:thioredoxin-related protein